MSRSYMNFSTAIWREDDFRSLSAEEQHVLFLIESQPDISAAGTLPLTLRRWAAMFRGGTIEGLRRILAGLQEAGRVVVDEVTEELLLCSFIGDDRGYRNSKRRPVILRAAAEANSPAIRRALVHQFVRFGLPTDALALPPGPGGPPPSGRSTEAECESGESHQTGEPDQTSTDNVDQEKPQVDNLSDRASQNEGDVGCTARYLVSPTHNPHLSSRTPAPSASRGAAGLVANALGTDDDETREVLDQIRKIHKPKNLTGYVRTMADNGDLDPVLDDVRRDKARRAATVARQAARAAMPDPATELPPTSDVTPEQAAADVAALRRFLAGRGPAPGGDPMRLGDAFGKAASA